MRAIGMSLLATMALLLLAIPAEAAVVVQGDGVDGAVVASVTAAGNRWASALSARSGCVGDVGIAFEDLSGRRGEYRTREEKVIVDVAVSPSEATRVVIHELAHHAFVACGGYADGSLQTAFYAAQGLPTSRGWFDYTAGWAATPAELFAEAMPAFIDGGTAHGVSVTGAARDVVSRWMRGQALGSSSTPTTTDPSGAVDAGSPAAGSEVGSSSTAAATERSGAVEVGSSAAAAEVGSSNVTPVRSPDVRVVSGDGVTDRPSVRLASYLVTIDDEVPSESLRIE